MRLERLYIATLSILLVPVFAAAGPSGGMVTGRVTYTGTPAKPLPINMSAQPECVKLYSKPLMTEKVVTGPGNALQNVVVYISAGLSDAPPVPATPAYFDQQNCRYTTHVLAFRVGQDVNIANNDPFNHNIHPMPKLNREWNKIQLPGTPPFTYSYDKEEFIPIKCNIHAWMQAYFVVLKTSHFAVTGEDGQFSLPELPSGKYTITVWHEVYGTKSQEITIAEGQAVKLDFVFQAKP
ncbi:MAG TPA: carboxypeptidase regulatory-like domain-containing protein [Candidatus Cybelea sp.]|nr:carboxypeptidase regulatory-like domain-containing protein [Candidatus Cybelea sp.]